MQTYESIIRQLRDEEKITLLTDIYSFATPQMAVLSLPAMKTASLFAKEKEDNSFPRPAVLARSFDTELVSEISRYLCDRMGRFGVNHVILPGPKGAVGTVTRSLSEDPYLAASVSGAFLQGATAAGMPACLNHYAHRPTVSERIGMASNEAVWAPDPPAERLVADQLQLPFARAMAHAKVTGILHEGDAAAPVMPNSPLVFCRADSGAETVLALRRGDICIQGVAPALRAARQHYDRLHRAVSAGNVEQRELDEALEAGIAISEEEMNEALQRLLELASACERTDKTPNPQRVSEQELQQRALSATTVLLENRSILPLKEGSTVALIGEAMKAGRDEPEAVQAVYTAAGHTVVGYAEGYQLLEDRNEERMAEAVQLAEAAQLLILHLQDDRKRYTGSLPANQVALCHRLSRCGKPYILVIAADHHVDLHFVKNLASPPAAILLASLRTAGGAEHTAKILTGQAEPQGRLAESMTDGQYARDLYRGMRRGPFEGYRFYDTTGDGMLYPFGHGLSYTKFTYSKAGTCQADATGCELNFTVTNSGKRQGTEVIQVYMGIRDSKVLRPKKELVGFARVTLEPGQSQTVKMSLNYPTLWGESSPESGVYDIYIGASVSDIRLHTSCKGGSGTPKPDGKDLCDYIPSISNIQKEHYTLEARYIPMKSSLRNIISGVIALILALGIKLVDVSSNSSSWFLNIAALALVLGGLIFFMLELSDRKKQSLERLKAMEKANKEQFAKSDLISAPTVDAIFAKAAAEDNKVEPLKAAPRKIVDKYDHFADVDRALTFSVAAEDLRKLGAKRGVMLDKENASAVFAALAASRLVLTHGMDKDHFAAFAALLGEYFNFPVGIDNVNGKYHNENDLLYSIGSDGSVFPRHALQTLRDALAKDRDIHIIFLNGMAAGDFEKWFGAYTDHIRMPLHTHTVMAKQPGGSSAPLQIPENIWFVCNMQSEESLQTLPGFVTELGSLNHFSFDLAPKTGEKVSYASFRYGQMRYLSEKAKDAFQADELSFKKIDRLEAFTARYAPYRMGNKLWLCFETYFAVLTQSGMEENEAMDRALAAELLPGMLCVLHDKIPTDDRGLSETMDAIFGDENTAASRRTVKTFGANVL